MLNNQQDANKNYYEVEPEQSQFYTVGVDVTHRCNMECSNCYSPIRDIPDVSSADLIHFFQRLGKKTEVRLTGGEPTLRSDLPLLIQEIIKSGHRAAIMTNGLKLANFDYCKSLRDAGLKFVCMSMNGADDDNVYEILDQKKCAELKMTALENLSKLGFFVNINCILVKGVSEHIPARLAAIFKRLNINGVIRIKNIGKLGRYMSDVDNFTFDELISLMCESFNKKSENLRRYNIVNGYQEEHNLLFPLEENKRLNTIWIKLTDWRPTDDSIPDPKSLRRGRMTKNFKVAPFFEHAKLNGY